jgi:hypothetical protein
MINHPRTAILTAALLIAGTTPAHATEPDHLISCEAVPARVYDVNLGGWKVQTTAIGDCTDQPDSLKSVLYVQRWVGLNWTSYASTTLVNPDEHWFQKTTSSGCVEGFYRSRVTVYVTEDGDSGSFTHYGPTAHINCGAG